MLDKLLVDAAAEAGAEVREGFTVAEIVADDGAVTGIRGHSKGGNSVTEKAKVVIGADGKHSLLAKASKPEQYNERPSGRIGLLRDGSRRRAPFPQTRCHWRAHSRSSPITGSREWPLGVSS